MIRKYIYFRKKNLKKNSTEFLKHLPIIIIVTIFKIIGYVFMQLRTDHHFYFSNFIFEN